MKSKSAEKIKLTSYDDLFGSSEVTAEEKIVSVPIRLFHTFKDHPFRVLDDEKMQETVESVKRYGILMPGIVRPYGDGEYEMVAGHRRWRACELAGMEEMPVIIREMDDDTATVIMVDTNIQREDILPSEKAHAYKMKYEAMKHQGSKGEKHTADLVGEAAGESGRTVQRYIRLSFLISRLLDYVDNKRLSMKAGEKLSFLTVEEQEWVLEAIDNAVLTVTDKQAELFKNHSREKTLNQGIIYSVLAVVMFIVYLFCVENGVCDYRKLWIVSGIPFGIQKMYFWMIPKGFDIGGTVGMFAFNLLIGGMIGSVVLTWRLLMVGTYLLSVYISTNNLRCYFYNEDYWIKFNEIGGWVDV